MAPNPRILDERLNALYERLPKIECQGLCSDSCGPISCSLREKVRMEQQAGHALGCDGISCNMLAEGKCSVYDARPMICRLWGLVESMPCHYGCRPEGGLLPDEEGAKLLVEAIEVGGPVTHSDQRITEVLEQMREELSHEEFRRKVKEAFKIAGVKRPTLEGRSQKTIFEK